MEQSILASDLRVIVRLMNARQLNTESMLSAAGIDAALLNDPRARVSAACLGNVITQLVQALPGTNLGLELARFHRITDTHVLGITAIASETGIEALRRLSRYQALVATVEPLTISEQRDQVIIKKAIVQDADAEHVIQVFLFAVLLGGIRDITGYLGDIVSVSFTGKAHGAESAYREVFGPHVGFSAKEATLVLPKAVLEAPISTSNIDILTKNEPMLASLVRAIREDNLLATLKMSILDHLPDKALTEEEAAASQNMSLRTFQRRIEAEGTRFRTLLDQTRAELAESLLADRTVSLSEVSYCCGFSEQASFSRAFKRWTGQTPSAYREALQGG